MNTYYLQHAEVKRAVERIWSGEQSESNKFLTRMRKFSRFYRTFCKHQVTESRKLKLEARADLAEAQGSFQEDPQNMEAQLLLVRRQAHLLTFETRKAEGKTLRSRLKWKSKGDTMSHKFFNVVKERSPRITITELTNPGGASLTRHKDIEETYLSFYKELYSAPARDSHTRQGKLEILNVVPACITPLMSLALQQPLSENELHIAACVLAKDKVPDPNGIAVNFFTTYWTLS